jgi:hypothetical protein
MATLYLEQFLAAHDDAPDRDEQIPDSEAYRRPTLSISDARIAKDKAAAIRVKIREIEEELSAEKEVTDGVPVRVLIGFYSPAKTASAS